MNDDSRNQIVSSAIKIETEPLWTVDDVANYLRLEVGTIRTMAKEGKLPGVKIGRVWRFRKKEIYSWIKDKCR
jgi:excisionase family DNA binding protein